MALVCEIFGIATFAIACFVMGIMLAMVGTREGIKNLQVQLRAHQDFLEQLNKYNKERTAAYVYTGTGSTKGN